MRKLGFLMEKRGEKPHGPTALKKRRGVVSVWEIAFVYSAPIRQQYLSLCFHASVRKRRNSSPPFTQGNIKWFETTTASSPQIHDRFTKSKHLSFGRPFYLPGQHLFEDRDPSIARGLGKYIITAPLEAEDSTYISFSQKRENTSILPNKVAITNGKVGTSIAPFHRSGLNNDSSNQTQFQ